ncbi:MAG TPA: class I SAM-dependent methyltransferase [Verrucomicrobiales bacterium]|nr:class I SAM-dependent methyltransferase [Verrucomicrobiales bacterium]
MEHGWFFGRPEVLRHWISPDAGLILELGAWLGQSTRWFAGFRPAATVVTVDHWQGSPEHFHDPAVAGVLPVLYETFLVNCWKDRDRIVPVRAATIAGMEELVRLGIQPDFVFIDAAHDEESVCADLTFCLRHFENAVIAGDDWLYYEVAPGVLKALQCPQARGRRLWVWNNVWGVFPGDRELPAIRK